MTSSVAPVAIIWDGSRQVAAIWRDSVPARFLAAEEAGGRISLIAAGNDEPGPLTGTLPTGSHILYAVSQAADGRLLTIPAQLDERLSLGEADRRAASLTLVQARLGEANAVSIDTAPATEAQAAGDGLAASGFNLASGSQAEGFRLLVGPFLHPADQRAATTRLTASRTGETGGLSLSFAGDDGQEAEAIAGGILVAHLPAAMREARQALAQIDQDLRLAIEAELDTLAASPADQRDVDATGLGRVAALRRGFRLLHPEAVANGACRLALPDWVEGDEVIVFAEPRRQLAWTGEGEAASGAPMTLRWQDGAFVATAHRESYAASAATGLTLGGSGNALVVSAPGAAAPLHDDLALAAARQAERLWQATERRRPARLGAVLAELMAARAGDPAAAGPLARLDARAKNPVAPTSLFEALAATTGLDGARTDELGERALAEQVAMLLQAVSRPRLAARACAVRMLLPLPGTDTSQAELERLLAWYEDPGLPHLLAREAMGLAGHDRRAMRLLHDIAASAHQGWLEAGTIAEVEQVVAEAGARRGQKRLSPLDTLLFELRRQALRQPPATPALEAVARMRSELAAAAAQADQSEALCDELARRLGELTPGEIVLLHGHFAGLRRAVEQAEAAVGLIRDWEEIAGLPGLAARAHRGGDPLRGAERLAMASRHFAGTLSRIESLAPTLAALAAEIERVLGPATEAAPAGTALRATLDGFGRLLLAQLVLREADAAFASVPFAARALSDPHDTGFGAAYRRLRAGTGDALPRYLAAAAALTGLDHHWGTRLAGAAAATAPGQDA